MDHHGCGVGGVHGAGLVHRAGARAYVCVHEEGRGVGSPGPEAVCMSFQDARSRCASLSMYGHGQALCLLMVLSECVVMAREFACSWCWPGPDGAESCFRPWGQVHEQACSALAFAVVVTHMSAPWVVHASSSCVSTLCCAPKFI